ncbi:hypothetical protein BST97_05240 [Nonlabens spongiae]|uniref:Chemotaxis methyl-accepting receptor HlyB-like 4HB MCP domain-containing protein n=1 Tax=Nonlabens spongiae TaxID=331648 RepID=A0A1W6MIX0_9FLAO|nr:MCP four helix bundle domain-containing protein [Nonlabens spongiae]ARN77436.1 hypothetical protein BST97_05240 [Nonlabens spongiae]
MKTYNKIKWLLGISMVFVLIVTTNLIDRNNFIQVKDSVTSLYEDRLVAKNIIYDMSVSIHDLELAIVTDSSFQADNKIKTTKDHLENLIVRFETTKLTKEEEKVFKKFKQGVQDLSAKSAAGSRESIDSTLLQSSQLLKQKLNDLAEIQLAEGGVQMGITKKAVETVELFTSIEIYVLIFLAIVIQIIILYDPKRSSKES